MNWKELLTSAIEVTYRPTEHLMELVDEDKLDWKPESGNNWMTTGQLLMHITSACGMCCKGFVTGDWGFEFSEDFDPSQMPPENMLPPVEALPTIFNVAEARRLLAEDKQLALDMVAQCSEEDLHNKPAPAPWDQLDCKLGERLLQMVNHLAQHKGQLFYYLKLQGKDVKTQDLWG